MYLLTWNPSKWPWSSLSQDLQTIDREGHFDEEWSCGVSKNIPIGARVFLMRLGVDPKGLVASGHVTTEPFQKKHWDPELAAQGKEANYVDVRFDYLADEPVIPISVLEQGPIADMDWTPQNSGITIKPYLEAWLESLWARRTGSGSAFNPDEIIESSSYEGAVKKVVVNRYERDPNARRACIAEHGTKCFICEMDFASRYGEFTRDYIHVHHVKPISEIGTAAAD